MVTYIERVSKWAEKDAVIIIICALCLLACLYTLITVEKYQLAINQVWMDEWESSGCRVKPYAPNITFKYIGDYDGIKD